MEQRYMDKSAKLQYFDMSYPRFAKRAYVKIKRTVTLKWFLLLPLYFAQHVISAYKFEKNAQKYKLITINHLNTFSGGKFAKRAYLNHKIGNIFLRSVLNKASILQKVVFLC